MTTRTNRRGAWIVAAAVAGALSSAPLLAQAPQGGAGRETPPTGGAQAQRGARGPARGQLPPVGANPDQQQVQAFIDTYALMQAEKELQLTAEQYPTFVQRLRHLHDVRRRALGERRRALNELRGLMAGSGPARDEAITEKVRALDETTRRGLESIAKAFADVDAGLTPFQRGRFRLLEERLERQKIDMLIKLGQSAPASPGRGTGRGGGGGGAR
jgi:hypothetical protein